MSFQNLQVNSAQLPQIKEVGLQSIEKTYLKVLKWTWLIIYSIILIAAVTIILLVDEPMELLWLIIAAVVYLLIIAATVVIGSGSFKRKAYAIREKDVLYRTGWLWQKLHIVPFNRVQHCMVRSGPIERRYGLAGITVYTAAGDTKDITIRGVKHDEAERLKEFIMQHVQPLQA